VYSWQNPPGLACSFALKYIGRGEWQNRLLPAKSARRADSFTLMRLKYRKNSRTDFNVILSSYLEVWNFMEPQDVLLPKVTSRVKAALFTVML
jgi:hypothetical protein